MTIFTIIRFVIVLQVRRKNVLKDYVNIAGLLNVSHFLMFTKTDIASNFRIIRLPRGPTLTFKVQSYCLARDVISSLKRPNLEQKQFQHHPLLVMNNFSGDGLHLKLMATMFQNMFPSINVNKVRCLIWGYIWHQIHSSLLLSLFMYLYI